MNLVIIIVIVVGFIFIKFIKDTNTDLKSFEVISFRERFYILTEFFSEIYFNNQCSIYEPTKTEIRIIGDGINANKMIQIYYTRKTLFVEINKKLFQIEYKRKYTLNDALLKTDETLVNFGERCVEDFSNYLNSKANF